MLRSEAEEVLGVNSRAELAAAEAVMQQRCEPKHGHGRHVIAPQTVFLSHDTRMGKDVIIEPNVVIGDLRHHRRQRYHQRLLPHGRGADRPGATVGPFARLRPGRPRAKNAHVGNFVEIKQSEIGEGAKVNHLTYIGDASVGAGANIGAGTITCNYDGFDKHRTEIGAGAFIGSNSSLVAPVKIGEGAYIGSGSVISKDVPPMRWRCRAPARRARRAGPRDSASGARRGSRGNNRT